MNLEFADRMKKSDGGVFHEIKIRKEKLLKEGKKVYDLSIGTPDFTPPKHVMEAIAMACQNPENYKYAIVDLPELQEAFINHYHRKFNVDINRDEITTVNGTQEGMGHIFLTLCNPGDLVLIPDPGYPIFYDGAKIAEAEVYKYSLLEESHFLPDLDHLPEDVVAKAKVMVVSYPLNPVGITAPDEFYEKLIAFAKKNEIIIIHDNAYSDIVFHGKEGKSFLNYAGAKEVGMEFFSLSKSYNMTGARVSFAVGNKEIIRQFKSFRSRIDYGMFLPIQYGAIAALNGPQEQLKQQCKQYEMRGNKLCQGLRDLGWNVPDAQGSMFVWAKVPEGYSSGEELCKNLLEKAGVIVTPGSSFGKLGESYVRFALVLSEVEIEEVIKAIKQSDIIN